MRKSSIGLILTGIMLITTTGVSCKLFNQETPPVDNSNIVVEPQTVSVKVTIDDGTNTNSYTVTAPVDSSVNAVMEQVSTENDLKYSTKENAGLGKFVDSLGGVTAGSSAGKYWSYSINGVAATAGVTDTIVQAGDVIMWEYKGLK